jgi:uncharacterized protein YidB (DUF937 family)
LQAVSGSRSNGEPAKPHKKIEHWLLRGSFEETTGGIMGLFDEVVGGLEAQAGQHAALYEEVARLITEAGGVNGLIQQFEQNGLGQVVSGWMGGASNTTISPDQIIQAIGQDKITAIASKVGLSEQQVTDGMAKLLPLMVSHLTPNGTAPSTGGGALESEALGILKSKLFGS